MSSPGSSKAGFTLIELLVVIAIIGLLTSTVLASLSSARAAARDAGRVTALKQVQTALEMYYNVNKAYPTGPWDASRGYWRSQCVGWGSTPGAVGFTNANVIPGLVPQYIPSLPIDPDMVAATNDCCFIYSSEDGQSYKFINHSCSKVNYTAKPTLFDPARDNGANGCIIDGNGPWSWAVYTPAAACI